MTDVNAEALQAVAARTGAQVVAPNEIFDVEAEVFAPCALGGAVSAETLPRLKAKVIAGGANNQLADPVVGRTLFDLGLLYAPDYVINGGGIINVAGEIRALDDGTAFDPAWVEGKRARLMQTLEEVLDRSQAEGRPTHEVAGEMARERIARGRATAQAA